MRFDCMFKPIIPQFQHSIIPIVSEANKLVLCIKIISLEISKTGMDSELTQL